MKAKVFSLLGNLRVRLQLLVLLAVVPSLGLLLYSASLQRRVAEDTVRSDALRLVKIVAMTHDRYVEAARQLLSMLSQVPEIRQTSAGCSAFLSALVKRSPQYANFGVINLDGSVACSAITTPIGVNLSDRLYFKNSLRTREFAVGEYQMGRITHKATVNFGYPIVDDNNQPIAVVFAALDLAWLSDFAAGVELPERAALTVTDRNGVVLARYPQAAEWLGRKTPEMHTLKAIQANPTGGVIDAVGSDGVMRLYGYTPLTSGNDLGVFVSIGVPTNTIYAEADAAFLRSLIGLLIVTLLASIAAWLGGDVFIVKQSRALVAATQRLARGDFDVRTGLTSNAGELGRIGAAFDDMARLLQVRAVEAQRATEEIALLQSMAVAVGAAEDLSSALAIALAKIGAATGWDYGQAWIMQENDSYLAYVGHWEGDGSSFAVVERASEALHIASGDELPGRAWATRQAIWITHVDGMPPSPRRQILTQAGFVSAIALPVVAGDTVVGVLEFFARSAKAEDSHVLDVLSGVVSQLAAVIARKRAEERVRLLAFLDPATGLPNRVRLHELLVEELDQAALHNNALAVILMELERFREINYTLGHVTGEKLLKLVAPRMMAALRDGDVVCHLGQERFGVLLPIAGAGRGAEIAQAIIGLLEQPFEVDNVTLDVGGVAGIALYPGHGVDAGVLLRCADIALYQTKTSGRSHAIYNPIHDPYNSRRLSLMNEFRHAIDSGELQLYCQPKASFATGRIVSVEALVRWSHPKFGLIAPDQFVPLVETTGLVTPFTNWMLEASIRQGRQWQQQGIAIPIAVNLAARNLLDNRVLECIRQAFLTWGGDERLIDLEVTESAVMTDPGGSLDLLRRLNSAGHRLMIDDYGTGYSSLSYLQQLPVCALKIDKSFVLSMLTDTGASTIVRSTIELGHGLGLRVIAEGVETKEIWDQLAAFGCDEAQGYYISRPFLAEEFAAWLSTSGWQVGEHVA